MIGRLSVSVLSGTRRSLLRQPWERVVGLPSLYSEAAVSKFPFYVYSKSAFPAKSVITALGWRGGVRSWL